ncbi:pyridoxamine 5'-phosphate oxidase family protein [Guptibacillus spartinae]|uniref:pyridoxamine 5'-phosphate oxidase family protein n=1 Tax=Guptibacillus spartinae TaxID=3025679 RepID=UPI00235DF75C|nr:pyridoxamine 5'-phosphate oxidase family protein [Pseudalkalibacillus spartinae]
MIKFELENGITNKEELRALVGEPSERAKNKVISHIDENCRNFLAMSPFLMMATSDSEGNCDSSPRGDAPGFVQVMDDQWLVIPERPGNKRLDSIMNILSNSRIGLIFLIPGLEETLRINGKATIMKDEKVLKTMHVGGKVPLLGIAVKVEECFIHCAKALKRSNLWDSESWPSKEVLPKPAKILAEHTNLPGMTEEKVAEGLRESYSKRMY